jgi:hypothetical protein
MEYGQTATQYIQPQSQTKLEDLYQRLAYTSPAIANEAFSKYAAALASPDEATRLRQQAEQYLHEGVSTLQDVGKSGGLDAGQWNTLASIVGGNPLEGVKGWAAPKNQIQTGLQGLAQSAIIENELQKQKANASMIGSKQSAILNQQDMSQLSAPIINNTLADTGQLPALNQMKIQSQQAPIDIASKELEMALRANMPPSSQRSNIELFGGARAQSGFKGYEPPKGSYFIPAEASPETKQQNTAALKQSQDMYNYYKGEGNPQVVQAKVSDFQNTIKTLMPQLEATSTDGVYKIPLGDRQALQQAGIDPKTYTRGIPDDVLKKMGVSSPTATILQKAISLYNTPGYEGAAQNIIQQLNNGQVDLNSVISQLKGGSAKYQQDLAANKFVNDAAIKYNAAQSGGRFDPNQAMADATKFKYTTPIPDTSRSLIDAASTAAGIDPSSSQIGLGYAADNLRAAIQAKGRQTVFQAMLQQSLKQNPDSVVKGEHTIPMQQRIKEINEFIDRGLAKDKDGNYIYGGKL